MQELLNKYKKLVSDEVVETKTAADYSLNQITLKLEIKETDTTKKNTLHEALTQYKDTIEQIKIDDDFNKVDVGAIRKALAEARKVLSVSISNDSPNDYMRISNFLKVEFNRAESLIVKLETAQTIQKLNQYIGKKQAEIRTQSSGFSTVKTLFSSVFNINTAERKIASAEKMVKFLSNKNAATDTFDLRDVECLTQGNLGKLINSFRPAKILPRAFVIAENAIAKQAKAAHEFANRLRA